MKIKTTDIENLMTAIFYRRKSHIGQHFQQHWQLLLPIPMAELAYMPAAINKNLIIRAWESVRLHIANSTT